MDVASVKHYLNATKVKQSALNARKPLVGGREPHLCYRPFKPGAYRDPLPLAEQFNHWKQQQQIEMRGATTCKPRLRQAVIYRRAKPEVSHDEGLRSWTD